MRIGLGLDIGMAVPLSGEGYQLFEDGFDTDGSLSSDWTGSTWTISGGAVTNTPTLGAEKLSNVEFATDLTGWTDTDGATLTRRDYTSSPNIDPTGGADDYGMEVASGGNPSSSGLQVPSTTVGNWYRASVRAYSPSANTMGNAAGLRGTNEFAAPYSERYTTTAEDAWQTLVMAARADAANQPINLSCVSATGGDLAHFDAPSFKQITTAELFAVVGNCDSDNTVSVKITRSTRAGVGLVICMDNPAAPINFIIAWLDPRGYCRLDKCVAGTYTNLFTTAVTYSAGATLQVIKNGTSVDVYYNDAQVDSTQTISDASVISNTYMGMLGTDPTVSFDDFSVLKKK